MYCKKCGNEIPKGRKKICDECQKSITKENEEVIKEKKCILSKLKEKYKKEFVKKVLVYIIFVIVIALTIAFICNKMAGDDIGNEIGNIRNYGYAVESGNWIYYLSPNEDSTEIGIFKIKNNGKDKKLLYMDSLDIVSLNAYKDYIYFIGTDTGSYLENDDRDNKIYRIKKDGSELEILNDNELSNECYEIYVIKDNVYYIGLNAEVCKMDLNGANKTVISDKGTGYLGITEKYIIYNSDSGKEDDEYVTYIMNIDGSDAKPIIEGKRLYSVSIEDDYVYYNDSNKHLYRTKIGSGVEELLYDNIQTYNLNTNKGYAYFLNYMDAENNNYTVCIYRVKLDGSSEIPEKIKELSTYSVFIDVVGDWVFYLDSDKNAGFFNLVNKTGNGKEVELYNLDYESFYENLDFSDEAVDSTDENEENDEEENAAANKENTSVKEENTVVSQENKVK